MEQRQTGSLLFFLSVIGPEPYGILRNLVQPELPKDKTYDELVATLRGHYMPKPLVISERFKFNKRNQRDGEKIADYIVSLKRLATFCEFGDFLHDALRDRLVCGLASEAIQKKLLSEDGLTFEKACQIATAMETADRDTATFQPNTVPSSVNRIKTDKRRVNRDQSGQGAQECFRCGKPHNPNKCKFKDSKCFKCRKRGHVAKKCPAEARSTRYIGEASSDSDMNSVYQFSSSGRAAKKIMVEPVLGSKTVPMELDTGSSVSIVSEEVYRSVLREYPLEKTDIKLKSYSGDQIVLLGQCEIPVKYGESEYKLPLLVAKGKRASLFGRNWLEVIPLNWRSIFHIVPSLTLDSVKSDFAHLWNSDSSKDIPIKGFKANIRMKENAKPIFCKARPVPYAVKESVEREFSEMEKRGIVYKVPTSEWATPLVVVPKPDKGVRICGDYKVTVNREISEERYPIPDTQDLFATLAGGKRFTKLDLSQAYTQLEVDKESEELLTVNTHMGLYRYRRLAYGVSSSPAIFQSVMDKILMGIPYVVCRIDDILVTGPDDHSHLESLREVLKRLSEHNIKLKKEKCSFMEERVVYMGHMVDESGIHATEEKIEDVKNSPVPTNVSQLKSFLGLIGYYRAFLPNLATVLHPLHVLLKQGEPWIWSEECEKAFRQSKQMVIDSELLVHYDVKKPVTLACDSSSYGIGAVISHVMEDGQERPIAFASRTLSSSEKNYAQIEKEALSIVFGVKKFHKYLYGRKFTLITDHKPLTTIFGPKKGVPTMAAARLQRWAVILSAYEYDIVYRKSADHANCDFLSRLPVKAEGCDDDGNVYVSYIEDIPVNSKDIAEATRRNPVLSKVFEYTLNGWPNHVSDNGLKPYFARRYELSVDNGVILWGLRVIIPEGLYRERLLCELHEEHMGMCKMKALARSYLWWPNLDADIEKTVQECAACMSMQNTPRTAPLHPWKWAARPWQRIHIDFAEHKQQVFLVVTDSYSKWLEILPMNSTTSEKTIEKLRTLFSTWGLPEELVSDNDPRFTSAEFKTFMQNNGIKHTLVPAYHPSSNGAAERAVQILKKALKKQGFEENRRGVKDTLSYRLAKFLLRYRNTPHTLTKESPAVLFLKRQLRSRLTLLKPNKYSDVQSRQDRIKDSHDKGRTDVRSFNTGDTVLVKTTLAGGRKWKWLPGTIHQRKGNLTYLVKVNAKIRYCHVDHLRSNCAQFPDNYGQTNSDTDTFTPCVPMPQPAPVAIKRSDTIADGQQTGLPKQSPVETMQQTPAAGSTPTAPEPLPRYPKRDRRPPDRLTYQ